MKRQRITSEALEKRCKEFTDSQSDIRSEQKLPPMSNSERLEMMAMLAKSLEQKYDIVDDEEIKGEENGNNE